MALVRGHYRRTESGYTYVRPHARQTNGSEVWGVVVLLAIGLVVVVIMAVASAAVLAVELVVEYWIYILATLAMAGGMVGSVFLWDLVRRGRVARYLESAHQFVQGADDRFADLARRAQRIPIDDQLRAVGEEELYRNFIAEILADGEVSDEECTRLQRVNDVFAFDPRQAQAVRQEAFDGFLSWVGVDLTEDEEAEFRIIATRLWIPQAHTDRRLGAVAAHRAERQRQDAALVAAQKRQAALDDELERQAVLEDEQERHAALEAERRRQAALETERERQVALEAERQKVEHARLQRLEAQRIAAEAAFEDPRTAMDVRVKLKRGESCWFAVPAGFQDRNLTRTGELLVTNKRVLFVADTAVSIDLSKILDIAADPETGMLRLIKDGRKTPYEFLLDQPLVALAHTERSLGEANPAG